MLLTHTSGIPNYMGFPDFVSTMNQPTTPAQLLARFEHKPLDFAPGTQWSYSNSGYAVLGFIIEKVSGQPYQLFVRTRIIEPLQLRHTGYDQNDPPLPQHATGYASWSDKALPIDVSVFYAAAGMYSTVEDLYRWDQALYTDTLVTRTSLRAMFTPFACVSDCGTSSAVQYGYGWFIGQQAHHPLLFHGGAVPGSASYLLRYPQDKLTIVVLSNLESAPVDPTIAQGLAHLVFAQR
jgi:CubicO group peptidase (beta-lactamase class C family)